MMYAIYKNDKILTIEVFDSLLQLSKYFEWQDLLDENLTIIDNDGFIYKVKGYATNYEYELQPTDSNKILAETCNNYIKNSPNITEFKIKIT
jgi:hypothetical protein